MNVDNALTGMSYYYNALVAVKLYGGCIKIDMLVKATRATALLFHSEESLQSTFQSAEAHESQCQ